MTDTSTALELAPPRTQLDTFQVAEHAWILANRISKTEFVPKGLQGKPEHVLAAILKGHELDLPPMTALSSIHVINGRPGLSAELQRALVQRAGHEVWFTEMTSTRVTCAGRRSDNGNDLTVTWTMDDAKRAKLDGKDVWRAYPRNMLAARASADVCKFLFPDVIGGLWTVEELEDLPPEDGVVVPALPAGEDQPAPVTSATRKAAAPTARARKKAAPARADAPPAAPSGPAAPLPPLPHELSQEDATEAEADTPAGDDPAVIERAKQIAMRAKDLGVDRAEVIYAVTAGRKTSGKACTAEEALEVIAALSAMKTGSKRLDEVDGEPVLVDVDPDDIAVDGEIVDDDQADDGSVDRFDYEKASSWDADLWRAFVNENGVKIMPLMREAQRFAPECGLPLPSGLDALAGDTPAHQSLCLLLIGWVEDQVAGRGES